MPILRRFSLLTAASLMVLLTTGCAEATSTAELPLTQAPTLDSRSVGGMARQAKVVITPDDPLAKIVAAPTGTLAGERVTELLEETIKLRERVGTRNAELQEVRGVGAASALQYHSSVGAIEARLRQGTTPGNPILLRQWDDAQANLDQMNIAVSRLNTLSTEVSSDASNVGYLLGSIKSVFELSGAVDEDHEHLKTLQDSVASMTVQSERMKTEISDDIMRLNAYMNSERTNLQTLAFAIEKGEYMGNNLANRPLVLTPTPVATISGQTLAGSMGIPNMYSNVAYGSAVNSAMVMPSAAAVNMLPPSAAPAMGVDMGDVNARSGIGQGGITGGMMPAGMNAETQNLSALPDESSNRLLALIRFNEPNLQYSKQLYSAASNALDMQPNALFTVVAVSPKGGDATQIAAGTAEAQRHADDVKRSLIEMGLPPNRIAMAASSNDDARTPEVHVLVR